MAYIADNSSKYSFKYSVSDSGESTITRTISGLNINATTQQPETGATSVNAVTALYNTLSSFTNGTLNDCKWIWERPVVI